MIKLGKFLKNNWPYFIMLAFVAFLSISIFTSEKEDAPQKEDTYEPSKMEMMDKASFQKRQDKIEILFHENLPVYFLLMALNLSIFLVFFGGIFLNILLIYKWKKRTNLLKRTIEHKPIRWGIFDVVKFAIMFYAFGYIFMILQSELAQKITIFNDRNFRFIFSATVMDIAGIVFVLNFVRFVYRENLTAIGLTVKNFFRNVLYGIGGYIAAVPLLILTLAVTAVIIATFKLKPPVQPIVDVLMKEDNVPVLIYSSLFASIAGPIMEEIFFRGFMYNACKKRMNVFWSIMITASIFSLLHAHVVGFLPILILGILLAYLYEKTGSLIPSMTVHIIHNLVSLAMVFLVKGFNF